MTSRQPVDTTVLPDTVTDLYDVRRLAALLGVKHGRDSLIKATPQLVKRDHSFPPSSEYYTNAHFRRYSLASGKTYLNGYTVRLRSPTFASSTFAA